MSSSLLGLNPSIQFSEHQQQYLHFHKQPTISSRNFTPLRSSMSATLEATRPANTMKKFGKGDREVPHYTQKAQKWYPTEDEPQPKKVCLRNRRLLFNRFSYFGGICCLPGKRGAGII